MNCSSPFLVTIKSDIGEFEYVWSTLCVHKLAYSWLAMCLHVLAKGTESNIETILRNCSE